MCFTVPLCTDNYDWLLGHSTLAFSAYILPLSWRVFIRKLSFLMSMVWRPFQFSFYQCLRIVLFLFRGFLQGVLIRWIPLIKFFATFFSCMLSWKTEAIPLCNGFLQLFPISCLIVDIISVASFLHTSLSRECWCKHSHLVLFTWINFKFFIHFS